MDRLHRVYGPPGTGKTTDLGRQAQLAAARYSAPQVVICSLTRAAAHEVAGRDTGIPRRNIGTLHAHAYRALDRPALAESSDGVKAWNQTVGPSLRLAGASSDDPEWAAPEDATPRGGEGDRLLAQVNVLRARMLPVERWPGGEHGRLASFSARWEAWKHDTSRVDFTDLIANALRDAPAHPASPAVLMVDECQDLSALEMALALSWGAHADQLVTVGDPDQNLYQWRGSDPSAFTSPPAFSERVLAQSYRVPQAVHAYAVDWIERIPDRPQVAYQPRPAPGAVDRLTASHTQPSRVAAHVAARLDAQPGSVMLLASCAYMLAPLVKSLREAGVAFHNPYRPTNGAWNPLGMAPRLLAYLRPHPAAWGDEARLWTWLDLWRAIEPLQAQGWLTRGAKTALEQAAKQVDQFGRRLVDEQAGPDALLSYFKSAADAEAFGRGDLDWYHDHLLASWRPRFAYVLGLARGRQGLAALRQTPRVVVGTIHSVKGGEADEVVVFPDLSLAAVRGAGPGRGWLQHRQDTDAILRQFYVAFTRARQRLTLAAPASALQVAWPRPA